MEGHVIIVSAALRLNHKQNRARNYAITNLVAMVIVNKMLSLQSLDVISESESSLGRNTRVHVFKTGTETKISLLSM